MIDKRTNPYHINLDIDVPFGYDEEIIKEFIGEVQKIKNKCIGQASDSSIIYQLTYDLECLLQNEKYMGITIKNNEFFNEEFWSLEKLLDEYYKEYPERSISKKEYTNMEVNNMLFELKISGVIGGYLSPAVCYDMPFHNNKVFTGHVSVQVPIINVRYDMR